jgi:ABC-type nitrate/sulfonate/bicarbonate transport system substrate-binding protein
LLVTAGAVSAVLAGAVASSSSAVAAPATSQSSSAAPVTTIKIAVSADYPALAAAVKAGTFRRAGVAVKLVPLRYSKAVVEAVNSGAVQLGLADVGVAMALWNPETKPFLIAAGAGAARARAYGMFAGAGKTPATFATVGVNERMSVMHVAALASLDGKDADVSAILFRQLGSAQLLAGVAGGDLDAAVVGQPFAAKPPQGATRVNDPVAESFGAGATTSVFIARRGYLAPSGALVTRLVNAMSKASGLSVKLRLDALEAESSALYNYGLTADQPDFEAMIWAKAPRVKPAG